MRDRLFLVRRCLARPFGDAERGATAVEYAFLVSVIALVMVIGAIVFGEAVFGLFDNAAQAF